MVRRGGTLWLAVGMSFTLPACAQLGLRAGNANPRVAQGPAHETHAAAAAVSASPYHELVHTAVDGDGSRVEMAAFPDKAETGPKAILPPPPSERSEKHGAISLTCVGAQATQGSDEEPIVLAMQCLLHKQPAEALEWLKKYQQPYQDLLLVIMPLAEHLAQGNASPTELAAILDQLDSLSVLLRPQASLTIGHMCLCKDIKKFGAYSAWPPDHAFRAGSDERPGDPVQVYVELQNFASKLEGQAFITHLAGSLVIKNARGEIVCRQDWHPSQPERSKTLRHDCFINCTFYVPANLPGGVYTLAIEVKDMTEHSAKELPAHRVARKALEFRVSTQEPVRSS
jgi:hypothetical protein